MDWSNKFLKASRAQFRAVDEREKAEPDIYVSKAATGAAQVHINDFESTAAEFRPPVRGERELHPHQPHIDHAMHVQDAHATLGQDRNLLPFPTAESREGEAAQARQDAAAQYRASLARIEALPPSQQEVLLRLRDYGSLVSWSQVTHAAHDDSEPKHKQGRVEPWNSLSNLLSPEALIATGLILEEFMAEMMGVPSTDPAQQGVATLDGSRTAQRSTLLPHLSGRYEKQTWLQLDYMCPRIWLLQQKAHVVVTIPWLDAHQSHVQASRHARACCSDHGHAVAANASTSAWLPAAASIVIHDQQHVLTCRDRPPAVPCQRYHASILASQLCNGCQY